MNKNELNKAFENIKPSEVQKERILSAVQNGTQAYKPKKMHRKVWYSAAACFTLIIVAALVWRFGEAGMVYAGNIASDGNTITLYNPNDILEEGKPRPVNTFVRYIDNGPSASFFIDGKDIAKIEVSCENEYLDIFDFSKTLDRRFWDPDPSYYEELEVDGEIQKYVPLKNTVEKSFVLEFPENFDQYEEVWYSWTTMNLDNWVLEDPDARIHSGGTSNSSNRMRWLNEEIDELQSKADEKRELLEDPAEIEAFEEALQEEIDALILEHEAINQSPRGHIILDGYPEEKLHDVITITITDRKGNQTTNKIKIDISNNETGHMVVTAMLNYQVKK
jgi:hypothetical protein